MDSNTNHPLKCATPTLQASKPTEKSKSAATKVAKLEQPWLPGNDRMTLLLSTPLKEFKLLANKVTGQITKYNQSDGTVKNGLMKRALVENHGTYVWPMLNTEKLSAS